MVFGGVACEPWRAWMARRGGHGMPGSIAPAIAGAVPWPLLGFCGHGAAPVWPGPAAEPGAWGRRGPLRWAGEGPTHNPLANWERKRPPRGLFGYSRTPKSVLPAVAVVRRKGSMARSSGRTAGSLLEVMVVRGAPVVVADAAPTMDAWK